MRPRIIGRALGIGVRVFGRTAWHHLAPLAQSAAAQAHQAASAAAQSAKDQRRAAGQPAARATVLIPQSPGQAGQSLGHAGQSASRGVGGFLRPFRRVGSVLWLEITGAFFLLPVVAFAPTLWRAAADYRHTSDHRTLWVTAVVVAVFLYLGVTSFWRASRRSRRS